jgi:hypothetical protein
MATVYSISTCPPEITCFIHQSGNVLKPDPIRFTNKFSIAKKESGPLISLSEIHNSPDNIQDIAQQTTKGTAALKYARLLNISDEFLLVDDDFITVFADFSSEEPTLDPEENLNVSNSFDNSMEKNSYDFPFSGSVCEIPLRREGKSMLNEQSGIHETDSQRSHQTDRNIKIQPDAIVINNAEIPEKVLSSTPSQIDDVDDRMKMLGFL